MEPKRNLELKEVDCEVTVKNPKRILHFSDGTLEEYSDSEEPQETTIIKTDIVDTANMGWGPWLVHKALRTGNSTLAACDYVGEALASFLGITTPKYQYELDEYIRIQRQRKENAAEDSANSWLKTKSDTDGNHVEATVIASDPTATSNVNVTQ